ncbi:transporter [Nonomuraea diastatica]|uniref:Transporter n=1 Tax=Nonomuraea diastatica TaxID=1848329 RepID=A0A4R4WSK6_9ACTN|nr:transporter [Nonomuraea diastatica]TDD20560.1 transporter [Nonomuraea diastatica]
MVEDDRPPSPEEMLRVIEEQRAATTKWLCGDPLLLYLPWGVAWLIGFTAFFLHYGLDGRAYAPISQMQALALLMAGQIVAGAIAAFGIVRMNSLVRGDSSARGAMYGYAWMAGMLLMVVICLRMGPLLPPDETGLLWAGTSLLVVAVLHMAGGALWLNWPMFFIGAWVAAVDALGVLLGAGWHALLTAVLLGGGFIVAGLWLRRHDR